MPRATLPAVDRMRALQRPPEEKLRSHLLSLYFTSLPLILGCSLVQAHRTRSGQAPHHCLLGMLPQDLNFSAAFWLGSVLHAWCCECHRKALQGGFVFLLLLTGCLASPFSMEAHARNGLDIFLYYFFNANSPFLCLESSISHTRHSNCFSLFSFLPLF